MSRARRLGRAVLNPVTSGAAWMAAVCLVLLLATPVVSDHDVLLGKNAADVANLVAVHYAREIRHVGAELVGLGTAFGAVLGAAAAALAAARAGIRGTRPRLAGPAAAATGLALVVCLHALCVARWMAEYPQIYALTFWHHGGALAAIERFVTDRLHPAGVDLLAAVGAVLYVAGSPTGVRGVRARASSLVRTVRRVALDRRRRGTFLALLAVAALAAVALCGPSRRPDRAPATRRPNVVVLAADGLRVDRLRDPIMPNLSALAARGTRFERAYTALPRTFASWMSLLTGLYPFDHGVRSDFPQYEAIARPFDAFPRRLAGEGYATAAVSDYAGDVLTRVDVGFDETDAPHTSFVGLVRQAAVLRVLPAVPVLQSRLGRALLPDVAAMNVTADPAMLAADAVRTLRRVEDRPFLLVVFFSTTHFPYAAPYPDYARFADPAYDGAFRYEKTVGLGPVHDLAPDDVRQTRALYDGAAHAVDAAAQRVLDALAADGLADRTIVVLTADHGENLYEEGRGQGHGDHLFGDAGTHVPLVVYDPRAPGSATGRSVPEVVETVDLAPTLCELAGVARPANVDGRSLAAAVRGEPLAPGLAHAETGLWLTDDVSVPRDARMPTPGLLDLLEVDTAHGDQLVTRPDGEARALVARHRMVRDARWKLVYAPTPQGARYALFDTAADPAETSDVGAAHPAERGRLEDALWSWMTRDPRAHREGDYLVPTGHTLADFVQTAPDALPYASPTP